MMLDDVLCKRDEVNDVLRVKLDEQTERWGGKVTTVEIRELTPPPDVQASMNRVLTAERTRRAVITESEGERQAKINVAEGEKQSAILRAEGVRQQSILEAEGLQPGAQAHLRGGQDHRRPHHDAAVLRDAQGAGHRRATKYVIPLELTDLARRLGNFLDNGLEPGAAARAERRGRESDRLTALRAPPP